MPPQARPHLPNNNDDNADDDDDGTDNDNDNDNNDDGDDDDDSDNNSNTNAYIQIRADDELGTCGICLPCFTGAYAFNAALGHVHSYSSL